MVPLRFSPYNGPMSLFSLVFSALPLLLPAQDPQPPRAGNLLQGEPQVLDNGQAASQITAMGDVHGDFKTFRALLRSVGLIDSQDLWCGGTRHLVQTGDLLDRGSERSQLGAIQCILEHGALAAKGTNR